MSLQQPFPRFPPCDQCLQRKVRCDKTLPRCYRCSDSSLPCTRKVVRRRPGRKKGSGVVISKLRTPSMSERQQWLDGSMSSVHGMNATEFLHATRPSGLDDGSGIAALDAGQITSSLESKEFLSSHETNHQSHDSFVVQSPSASSIRQRTRSRSIGEFQLFSLICQTCLGMLISSTPNFIPFGRSFPKLHSGIR